MSDFPGETVHANNPATGAQEQAQVVEVYDDGRVKVQFSDGSVGVFLHNELMTG